MVEVDPALRAELEDGQTFLLQVRSDADSDQLSRVLVAIGGDIAELGEAEGGPSLVSEPIPTPDGPMLLLDMEDVPLEELRTIPDLAVNRLVAAGIENAVVRQPALNDPRLEAVYTWTPAVRCWLRGRTDVAALFEAADTWLRDRAPADAAWFQYTVGALFPLAPDQARPAVQALVDAHDEATALVTDFATSAHTINVQHRSHLTLPQAALSVVGTPAVAELHDLREFVRAHAEHVVWAGVGAEPDARDLITSNYNDRTSSHLHDPDLVADLLVPDGLWFQLLTAGHLDRLGGPPPGAVELAPGVVELTVGEPEQWLPGHPDQFAIRQYARELLEPCLANSDRRHTLGRARLAELRRR